MLNACVLFSGHCIVTYWRYGNWLGAVQCPVCRQQVSLLMKDFSPGSEDAREIERNINDYNRRFSGQPRPVSWEFNIKVYKYNLKFLRNL